MHTNYSIDVKISRIELYSHIVFLRILFFLRILLKKSHWNLKWTNRWCLSSISRCWPNAAAATAAPAGGYSANTNDARTRSSFFGGVFRRQWTSRRVIFPQVIGESADSRGIVAKVRVVSGQISYRIDRRRTIQRTPRAAQAASGTWTLHFVSHHCRVTWYSDNIWDSFWGFRFPCCGFAFMRITHAFRQKTGFFLGVPSRCDLPCFTEYLSHAWFAIPIQIIVVHRRSDATATMQLDTIAELRWWTSWSWIVCVRLIITGGSFLTQSFWHKTLRFFKAFIVQLLVFAFARRQWWRRHVYIGDESAAEHGALSRYRAVVQVIRRLNVPLKIIILQAHVFSIVGSIEYVVSLMFSIKVQCTVSWEVSGLLLLVYLARRIARETDSFLYLARVDHTSVTFATAYCSFGEHHHRFAWPWFLHHWTQYGIGYCHYWWRLTDGKSRTSMRICCRYRCRRRRGRCLCWMW